MKAYWDSSALISATEDAALIQRLASEKGFSRRHSLAEIFSTLTGKARFQTKASVAAQVLQKLADDLEFIELSNQDILDAATQANPWGVPGRRIHDLLYAKAALKSGASTFLTLDRNDFENLVPGLAIEQLQDIL